MTAIFTGLGSGFARSSAVSLGSAGLIGSGSIGRGGDTVSVNAATGNLLVSQQDEFLAGRGLDVGISRTYNSLAELADGDNGDNWQMSTMRRVFFDAATNTVTRQSGDGSAVTYTAFGTDYRSTDGDGAHDILTKVGANWVWRDGSSQTSETYAEYPAGSNQFRITHQTDTDNFSLSFTYVGDLLDKVTTANGEWVQYSWSGTNLSKLVTGAGGTTLTRTWYEYSANRLSRVRVDLTPADNAAPTDAQSYWTAYGYDAAGRVNLITQKDGSQAAIVYDGSGRVSSVTQTAAAGNTRVTSLVYGANYTNVTGPDGQVTRLDYDAAKQLTKITAPPAFTGAAAQVAQFAYDTSGNLINTTAPGGGVTTYLYNATGTVQKVTSPDGKTVESWYDTGNRLIKTLTYGSYAASANVAQYARYAYDSEGHLRYSVSAEGGVTEYRYTAHGLLSTAIEYPENLYAIGSGNIDEASMDAWRDAIVDRSSTKITTYTYDVRGNQMVIQDYGYATVIGTVSTAEGYSRTFYTYDQAGKLLSRYDQGEAVETYVYDGMGRLTASTNSAGGTTTIVLDDVNTTTVMTTASGYVTTKTYNKAGELVSSTGSGSFDVTGTSTYQYDKNGRVKVSTDETGYASYFIYDKAGRKVADINGFGQVTEYRYDANNRIIATTSYYNALSGAQLTLAANPAGTPEMSALRPVAHANYDVGSWTIYSADGLVSQTIDGAGRVTAFEYDNSGRPVRTIAYATNVAVSAYKTAPPTAPVTVTVNAADVVTRTFYNRDGQIIGVLDGEGYLTENVYDAAGQKVEEIAYGNRPTSSLWTAGSFTQLRSSAGPTHASNRRVHHVYDGQGQLRYTVDNGGHANAFTYSLAGKLTKTTEYAVAIAPTDFTYDAVKAAVVVTSGSDRSTTLAYDSAGRVATSTNAVGTVTTFTYDASDRVIKTQMGTGTGAQITRNYYTAGGLPRFTVDAEGFVRRFDYDAAGRTIREVTWDTAIAATDAMTITDVNALLPAPTAANSADQRWEYDSAGRVSSAYDGVNSRTHYVYYGTGQVADVYHAYGTADQSRTHYLYDGAGRLTHEYAAYGETEQTLVTHAYNGLGQKVSTTDPRSGTTSFAYDENGRILSSTNAASGVTTFEYNAFGEVTRTVDPRGFATLSSYNTLGQLTQTTDATNVVTSYTYTQFGDLATVAKAGATTSFTYDRLGRILSSTDAMNFVESYTYDAWGNRASATNKLGGVTTYAYDRLGLMLSELLPVKSVNNAGTASATNILNTYAYDARGNRISMIEAAGFAEARTTLYEYDDANRLTKIIGPTFQAHTPTTHYAYDLRGNKTRSTDPAGGRTIYYYDDLGRATTEINAGGTYTAYTYDANSNVSTIKVYETLVAVPADGGSQEKAPAPSGTFRQTSFTYDALNRMTMSSVVLPSGYKTGTLSGSSWTNLTTASLDTLYTYDAAGNVVTTTDPNGDVTWSYYDALGRKTAQVDPQNFRTNWTYNADGNVTSEIRYGNAGAAPTSTTTPPAITVNAALDRTTNYTYDLNGNRLTEQRLAVLVHNGSGGTSTTNATITYSYNGLGQVTRKTEATADFVDYSYDTAGRLITEARKAYADQTGANVTPTVTYSYDGLGNLTRTRAHGNTNAAERITTYEYSGGKLIWMKDAEAQDSDSNKTDGVIRQYTYDINGRQTAEYYKRYNSAGSQTAAYEAILTAYDAMGRVVQQWQGSGNGSSWSDSGPRAVTTYNAHGEAVSVAVGSRTQQQNKFDQAGRLWATSSGDGVWKYFGYDKNGNQTAAITSAGENLTGLTFDQARLKIGQANVNATYTLYDARNSAISVMEEGRQLAAGGTAQTLTTSRQYNAFREVTTETNALNASVNYVYNKAGKLIRSESPGVKITDEQGLTYWVKPSEDYYYDASGRLVATRDANGTYATNGTTAGTAKSKAANTGNLTRLTLLTGTGYGGSEALVTSTLDAGGGTKTTKYDIHGDARTMISELGFQTLSTYDKMGRLTIRQEVRAATSADDLITYYAYDGLGQQIKHWNDFYGSANVEKTDYDIQGRIISSVAFGGDTTLNAYVWLNNIVTTGLGTFGGWKQTTTFANAKTLIEETDLFGRQTSKKDLGDHTTTFAYDVAGRLATTTMGGTTTALTWLNSGHLGGMQIASATAGVQDTNWTRDIATYSYDKVGNRLTEQLVNETGKYTPGYTTWIFGNLISMPASYVQASATSKNATTTYDALGRLATWAEAGGTVSPASSITQSYDAAGNIRRTQSAHRTLDASGVAATTATNRDHWFRFDAMHRMVVSEGVLSGGVITAGTSTPNAPVGKDITYNAGSQRTSVTVTNVYQNPTYGFTYSVTRKELYTYDAAGRLVETQEAATSGATTGTKRSTYSYDRIGRQIGQQDFGSSGTSVIFNRYSVVYNAKGQLTSDITTTLKTDNTTHTSATTYHLTEKTSPNQYLLGAVGWQQSTNSVSGQATTTSQTINTHDWYDGAVETTIAYDADIYSTAVPVYTTTFTRNALGQLTKAQIADGKYHEVTFLNDELGQVIRRDETNVSGQTGAPHEVWYRYGGRQMGSTGNNGTSDMAMWASIFDRQSVPPANQGTFRNKQMSGTAYADLSQSYDPLNSYSQGSSSGSYTVQAGDTLQSIAQGLYGDSGLWYKIAEINGMSAYSGLTEGQRLTLPTGVMRSTHNASSFKAYDPSSTLGDVNPTTTPTPPKGKKGCGGFGQILMLVVAVAVSVWLGPQMIAAAQGVLAGGTAAVAAATAAGTFAGSTAAIAGGIAGGALTGAIASVASQAVGVASGIQDKFSWKAVGLAAIGGGIGGGLNAGGLFDGVKSSVVQTGLRASTSSALSQGIGVATGLQDTFSWAGVAAAGVGAAAGGAVGARLGGSPDSFGNTLATSAASGIANAATRSAIEGSNFGRNVMAALPDIIGQAVGGALGRVASEAFNRPSVSDAPASEMQATAGEQISGAIVNISGARNGNANVGLSALENVGLWEAEGLISSDRAEHIRQVHAESIRRSASRADALVDQSGNLYRDADLLDPAPSYADYYNTSYAASQFELNLRNGQYDSALASGDYDKGVLAVARDALDHNAVLLDGWTRTADREVINLIGSVYGAVDVAKGVYRIGVNGEHTLDNYVSAGSGAFGAALGGAAKVGVKLGATGAAESAVPQVTLNKAAGDAFEADVITNLLPKTQVNIRPQITIRSNGPSGMKVRLDALGDDVVTGGRRLSDMKASSTAPLTPNQTVVYPELELYGGVVVGKGKAPYVGGTNIPPTAVDVIRKTRR